MANVYNHFLEPTNKVCLSIIITFCNQSRFVDKCLRSVIEQKTKYSYEIIVIDDCSTDNTIELVGAWVEKYPETIKLFKSTTEPSCEDQISRVSKCRLLGLSNSTGKYLCFLDGDDYFASREKFEKQIDLLESNPKCCACLSSYISTTEDGDVRTKIIHAKRIISKKQYIKSFYLPSATMIYKNAPFACYDDNFDDNSISFSLFSSSKLCCIDDVTFCHFKTNNGSWLNKTSKQKYIAILKNICDAILFSKIRHRHLLKRYRSFIFDIYSKRKEMPIDCKDVPRNIGSVFLKTLIDYDKASVFKKIYVKTILLFLIIDYRFSKL